MIKEMHCEVCGSTDLKRADDDIFECQSCGVQFNSQEFEENEFSNNVSIETEKQDSHIDKPMDEYSCFVEFEAYFKGHEDECLYNPNRTKVEDLFKKITVTIPEGGC